ncbi:MAG: tetratricopeptide repeat protein [Candidatus Aureabacteria bacterium]|nr:tetratricopeptide repeat protein [Candidatus Auribacterota bacterium]
MQKRAKTRRSKRPLAHIDTPAKKKLYQNIAEHPQQISAFKELARLLREDAQYKGAIEILIRGLAAHRHDRDLRLHLAKTYAEAGETSRAIAFYKKLLKEKPEDPLPYERIERIFRENGRYEDVIRLYAGIDRKNPLKERSHERIHHLLVEKMRDFRRGAANLLAAIEAFGSSYRRCKDLGRLYSKIGKWDEASRCYSSALGFKKDDADLIALLGWALVESGQYQRAEECFKKISGIFQGSIGLAELLLRLNRLDEAETKLNALTRRHPDNSRIAVGHAELRMKRGDAHGARQLCEEALPRIPSYFGYEQARAHELLAETYKKLGDKEVSRFHREIATALRQGPDTYTSLIRLAEEKIAGHALSEAERVLERVLTLYPHNSRALLDRAEIRLLTGHPEQAISLGEEALRRATPQYKEEQTKAHLLLSRACARLKDRAGSKRNKALA